MPDILMNFILIVFIAVLAVFVVTGVAAHFWSHNNEETNG